MHFAPELVEQRMRRKRERWAERQMNPDMTAAADRQEKAQLIQAWPSVMDEH